MNGDVYYWLWLQQAVGFHAEIGELIRAFGSAKGVFEAGENAWRTCGIFGSRPYDTAPQKIAQMKSVHSKKIESIVSDCEKYGIDIISYENELYPKNLRQISDCPAVLYAVGDLSCLKDSLCIAVIGTRKPSVYGVEAAESISRALARENTVIVSGGALGIDSIAHQSAIKENAKTVLVMGCGHLSGYLPENEALRRDVSGCGAVISEYPPFYKAGYHTFPKRNRIISGLSQGVVIIEAGEKSGTLNTATHAKRQGRDIFAVPGDISSLSYQGSNKLIREGATAVFGAQDILDFYQPMRERADEKSKENGKTPFEGIDVFSYGGEPTRKKKKAPKAKEENSGEKFAVHENENLIKITEESVSANAFLVYNHISGGEMALDELTKKCALPVRKVLIALTELEMLGAVCSLEGNRYCLKQ